MKKFILFGLLGIAINLSAQKKNNCEKIINSYYDTFNWEKPSVNLVRECLSKKAKKVKIEIVNKGSFKDLEQVITMGFTKVNNFDLAPILKDLDKISSRIKIDETYDKTNWRNGIGEGISDLKKEIKVFQGYGTVDYGLVDVEEIEVYETTAPILGFKIQMYMARKDNIYTEKTDFVRIVNIYADSQLIDTKEYSFEELTSVEMVNIEHFFD